MRAENWPDSDRFNRSRRDTRLIERLADQSLSTALRHAQEAWNGADRFEASKHHARKPPKPKVVTIPQIKVSMGKPVSVATLKALQRKRKRGQPLITPPGWRKDHKGFYVWSVPGSKEPIYVGEVRPTSSVTTLRRLYQEMRGKGAAKSEDIRKLADLLSGKPVALSPGAKPVKVKAGEIYVQPGSIVNSKGLQLDFSRDATHHGVELLLKAVLNPHLGKEPLTFEENEQGVRVASGELDRLVSNAVSEAISWEQTPP